MEQITDYKLLLDTAVLAGQIMLANGAEIYRVEDTIHRILRMSGLKTAEAYVTATGFVATLDDPKCDSMTVVRRIENRDTDLNKITITNGISRRFCAGEITLKEAFHELKHMEANQYGSLQKTAAIAGIAAGFAVLFGGSWQDVCGAAVNGVLVALMLTFSEHIRLNSFMVNTLTSLALAVGAVLLSRIPGAGMHMDTIIIGSIMPIVPGAALTTAIRDTLQGDYVAGGAKLLEACIKALAIVLGVGVALMMMGGA